MRDGPIYHQIKRNVALLAQGVSPSELKGSFTILLAVNLISGKQTTQQPHSDESAWQSLDESQKFAVVDFNPAPKFMRWAKKEKLWFVMDQL